MPFFTLEKQTDRDSELPKLTFDQIRLLREMHPDKKSQNELAGLDRMAFARDFVKKDPIVGGIGLPFAIPLDYAARKVGIMKGRSDPTIDQLIMGLKGYTTGINDLLKGRE